MALIKCPECGGTFSDMAECCPHCGFPIEEIPNYSVNKNTCQNAEVNVSSANKKINNLKSFVRSQIFYEGEESRENKQSKTSTNDKKAIWISILCSLLVPVIIGSIQLINKKQEEKYRHSNGVRTVKLFADSDDDANTNSNSNSNKNQSSYSRNESSYNTKFYSKGDVLHYLDHKTFKDDDGNTIQVKTGELYWNGGFAGREFKVVAFDRDNAIITFFIPATGGGVRFQVMPQFGYVVDMHDMRYFSLQ